MTRRGLLSRVGQAALAAGLVGTSATAWMPDMAEAASSNDRRNLKDVKKRRNVSFGIRVKAASAEKRQNLIKHQTNGDEERYPNRIGNFSKTLPHARDTGEVDPGAYKALLRALKSGQFDDFENVPSGGIIPLLNPLGALAFNVEGPDNAAIGVQPPPPLASPEFAAQLAELYWMASIRDVPFTAYATNRDAREAQADLAAFSGYTGPSRGGVIGPEDLFRAGYPGETAGPLVSQFLYQPFRYDGITVDPRIDTPALAEFMTDFPSFVSAQNGDGFGGIPTDGTTVYPRTARDLGKIAGSDFIISAYFRAAIVLGFGGPTDLGNPYNGSTRQAGFATFGGAHLIELIGKVHKAERHAWYQKWCVHRFLRPEAAGARVHRVKVDGAPYPIHPDLLDKSSVLDRILKKHGSYLLPQMFPNGSPSHPSFTAGHAITAGACVTVLKAWFDENAPWPLPPVEATPDGQALIPYAGGAKLTLGGELNKLAHNLSFGRDMSGVHWRADDIEGNKQGEQVAIRLLREEKTTYPEKFSGFRLTTFAGDKITI